MKSMDVMVIDDEPAIRQILTAHLSRAGYNVLQASNGLNAFELLSKGEIDVAICDIKMPDISGIELVRRARAAGIDTSFIMMTAFASSWKSVRRGTSPGSSRTRSEACRNSRSPRTYQGVPGSLS